MWSGGKVANWDRVEWKIIPDPATAAAALQQKEVDWVETPLIDLLPMLRKSPGVTVDLFDKLGTLMVLAFNFYAPPFNNVKLRRAVLSAVKQEDYVNAVVGEQTSLGRVGVGVFPLALPYASTAGLEAISGPRDLDKSKRLVEESGYKGEPIVLMVPSDQPTLVQTNQVTNALHKSIGLNCTVYHDGLGHSAAAPQQPGVAGQGRLEQLLHRLGRLVRCEPLHAPAATREWRNREGLVASHRPAPRGIARSMAGCPGSHVAEADLQPDPGIRLRNSALHPDWSVLQSHSPPRRSHRLFEVIVPRLLGGEANWTFPL